MGRQRIYWNDDWGFNPQYEESMKTGGYPTEKLQSVRLPHTVAETPFHYFDENLYQKVCGYRKCFIPEQSWQGKRIAMTVEAAGHQAQIFLNGIQVAEHRCGYTAFTAELTEFLKWGEENVLVIRVDSRETLNQPPFGNVIDYMTYGGLYREVYLEITEKQYIADVFIKTTELHCGQEGQEQASRKADVMWESEITLAGQQPGDELTVEQSLWDENGEMIQRFPVGEWVHTSKAVKIWSTENPCLYLVKTTLRQGEQEIDSREERVGFRTVDFRADGLYLNDCKIKLRGLNRHQSFPYVGYAMPKSMQRRDAEILKKELRVNAVRTSHYPQSRHFLDRCDELGLLVFTEIPGWQHIGDEDWKKQAVKNTEDMVRQYRNHPSVFLWGVRINESLDDDIFYKATNEAAHKLDDTRPTSGVRYLQKSSLLEDVYAYNDFSHDGTNAGCMKRKKVTPDGSKGYLISEYNGHMFPTKSFDCEDHRTEQLLRHARVMDGWYGEKQIAGGFGWCMFDYNTHKDFGSGDRICYHGVMDMFRNPKPAAAVYAAQGEADVVQGEADVVLEISSAMDIGEHPACLMKDVYAVTNADSVRLFKNDQFVGEFDQNRSPYKNLPHGPILIDDFIGELMEKGEGFSHKKAEEIKKILMAANKYGLAHLPFGILMLAAKCMLLRGMKMQDAVALYNKYVGNWGGTSTTYRFEAVKDGRVVKSVEKSPMKQVHLQVDVSHTLLQEESTYDVAALRIRAVSENGNLLPFYQEAVRFATEGDIALIGPAETALRGGMGGTYIKSTGRTGTGRLKMIVGDMEPVEILFEAKGKVTR